MSKKQSIKFEYIPFSKLVFLENNPRTRTQKGLDSMAADIESDPTFYENRPTLVNLTNGQYRVYAGDLRAHAAHDKLGWKQVPCNIEADVPQKVMERRAILDNTHREGWDSDALNEWDFTQEEFEELGVFEFVDNETKNPKNKKTEEIKPYYKTHILISFNPQDIQKIQPFLDDILKIPGIEYEQGSN